MNAGEIKCTPLAQDRNQWQVSGNILVVEVVVVVVNKSEGFLEGP
jgi:hypothetical protein